jgi:hypothetical protein
MLIWSQIDTNTAVPLVTLIINMGFSALVAWYLLTKAGPKMQKDFIDGLQAQRDRYDKLDSRRTIDAKEALEIVIKHCEKEAERHAQTTKEEAAEVTMTLKDLRYVLEEMRDQLKDMSKGRRLPTTNATKRQGDSGTSLKSEP